MPCYHPIIGYRSRSLSSNGKRPIVFKPHEGFVDMPVQLPCGQCIGCRLERSRQWAVRCVHEASLHEDNCFITLTYDDEHCPESLDKSEFQKFMKRLRKRIGRESVRYYHCGEYGDRLQRPHYHACLFGYNFPDRKVWSIRSGVRLYRSELLESLWSFGFSTIGDVTFESSAYVARYIMKKQTGDAGKEFYGDRLPPYTTMSRRPGLGAGWLDKYSSDVFPSDFIVVRNGLKCRPPRYYDNIFDNVSPDEFAEVKKKRLQTAKDLRFHSDNSPSRLSVREAVKESKVKELRRSIHEG